MRTRKEIIINKKKVDNNQNNETSTSYLKESVKYACFIVSLFVLASF